MKLERIIKQHMREHPYIMDRESAIYDLMARGEITRKQATWLLSNKPWPMWVKILILILTIALITRIIYIQWMI